MNREMGFKTVKTSQVAGGLLNNKGMTDKMEETASISNNQKRMIDSWRLTDLAVETRRRDPTAFRVELASENLTSVPTQQHDRGEQARRPITLKDRIRKGRKQKKSSEKLSREAFNL